MRLGTLARKISITPSKLTTYLESQAIELPSGTNTKLTDEQIQLVLDHFDTSLEPEPEAIEEPTVAESGNDGDLTEMVENETQVEKDTEDQSGQETEPEAQPEKTEVKEKKTALSVSDSFAEIALPHELEEGLPSDNSERPEVVQAESIEENQEEEKVETTETKPAVVIDPEIESEAEKAAYDDSIEVIKPPKVKLPGLKVKGKIDLPEPKAPVEKTEETKPEERTPYDPNEVITTTGPKRERRRKPKKYKGKKYDKDYNPLEAARKKKEWEEKKQKEREERKRKNAKALHYKKNVAPAAQVNTTKKKPKKASIIQKKQEEKRAGNFLQKFWRWMNT